MGLYIWQSLAWIHEGTPTPTHLSLSASKLLSQKGVQLYRLLVHDIV